MDKFRRIAITVRSKLKEEIERASQEGAPGTRAHRKDTVYQRNPVHERQVHENGKGKHTIAINKAAQGSVREYGGSQGAETTEVDSTDVTFVSDPTTPTIAPVSPIIPTRVSVPKKPIIVDGVGMSSMQVAYFCMEIALHSGMPTYAGGLGVLAGDLLRSAADLSVPMIGITLLHRKGYFRQRIDPSGWQFEDPDAWRPEDRLFPLTERVMVHLDGRDVIVRAWMMKIEGVKGNTNPVILLDTDVEGNTEEDRRITDHLYGGDHRYRLRQEAILGIGGLRILEANGATNVEKFHMNEGHSALLTVELFRQLAHCVDPIEEVRSRCVFTTHTPVAAGHDAFPESMVREVLGDGYIPTSIVPMVIEDGQLNMTRVGFHFSHYINGVAKRHGEVTRDLFPGYRIESITNGVYARRWVSEPFARLYTKYLPEWERDPYSLRYALSIPQEELWRTHEETKRMLIEYVRRKQGVALREDVFTIGFARRATAYKRGNMLFSDLERIKEIARHAGGLQVVYAGKAHPNDHDGKLLIQRIIDNMRRAAPEVTCVYLDDYDMDIARILVSGVDLWLNTPTRPQEASGTSGMKAALNGVPQFSVLDGWWLEGHIEGVTGFSIGKHPEYEPGGDQDREELDDLYTKLEYVIIPRYKNERDGWVKMMRQAIAINGSFFNTHRMLEQYVLGAYFK